MMINCDNMNELETTQLKVLLDVSMYYGDYSLADTIMNDKIANADVSLYHCYFNKIRQEKFSFYTNEENARVVRAIAAYFLLNKDILAARKTLEYIGEDLFFGLQVEFVPKLGSIND